MLWEDKNEYMNDIFYVYRYMFVWKGWGVVCYLYYLFKQNSKQLQIYENKHET